MASMSQSLTLNFMADTMLGLLIDQMFPTHVHELEETEIAHSFLMHRVGNGLKKFNPETPWCNTLPLLHSADLNLLNLETSVTTQPEKWPDKVFNYRMHPANIAALQAAKVHYAGLANNHTLDFCEAGLSETVNTVREAGIAFVGAGETAKEATRPAVLKLQGSCGKEYQVHVWAAADHPADWAEVPTFHSIKYTQRTKERLKDLLLRPESENAALRVFSVHWGPNYTWQPADEIREMAHFLVDEGGVHIVRGILRIMFRG